MSRTPPPTAGAGPAQEASSGNAPPLAGLPASGLSLMNPAVIDSLHRLSEVQMNLTRFASDCAQRSVRLSAALASCRSPAECVEVWRKAATEAIAAYADEAARIVELGRR